MEYLGDWKMAVASGVVMVAVETVWKRWKEKKEDPPELPKEEVQVEEVEEEAFFFEVEEEQKPPTIGKKRTREWIIEREDNKKSAVEAKGSVAYQGSDQTIKQNIPEDQWPSGDENTSSAGNFIFGGGRDEDASVAGKFIFGGGSSENASSKDEKPSPPPPPAFSLKSDVSNKGKEGLELSLATKDENEDGDEDDWDGASVESGLGHIDYGPMPWDEIPLKDVGYLDMDQVLTDVLRDLDEIHSCDFVHTSVKVENIKRRWKRGSWNFFLGGDIRASGDEEEDIFCLGKVFLEICDGRSPPSHVEEVVSKMMQEDESQRPCAYEAFETIRRG
ncbi:hypothetical protein BSKO_03143 [Bryopsis sp. KO-2023]|nr:hypothetical protein BSKO_03143 [Bryopsis sp. KO-2023]